MGNKIFDFLMKKMATYGIHHGVNESDGAYEHHPGLPCRLRRISHRREPGDAAVLAVLFIVERLRRALEAANPERLLQLRDGHELLHRRQSQLHKQGPLAPLHPGRRRHYRVHHLVVVWMNGADGRWNQGKPADSVIAGHDGGTELEDAAHGRCCRDGQGRERLADEPAGESTDAIELFLEAGVLDPELLFLRRYLAESRRHAAIGALGVDHHVPIMHVLSS